MLNFFRFLFLTVFVFSAFGLSSQTRDGDEKLNMQYVGHGTHSEYYPPADMPEAYFDSNDLEITIEAEGYADYYIVEVVSMVSSLTVIYTQIDGYGDSIDVSSLPIGYYQLIITSEFNNVYEGYFTHKNDPRFSPFNYK